MSGIAEIESAIEQLSDPQLAELTSWLEKLRAKRRPPMTVDGWLQHARGAALPGWTTANVMALSR